MEILKERELIDKNGKVLLADEIISKAKLILLYFGAFWSDNNLSFLPKLIEIYEASKERNCKMEIIFISSDYDENSMLDYFKKHGDWYAVNYEDILADELRWSYMVAHIPYIIVTKPDGLIVSKNAYQDIIDYGRNVLVKWF